MKTDQIKQTMEENYRKYCQDWDNDDTVMPLSEYVRYNLHHTPETFDCFFTRAWDELDAVDRGERYFEVMEVFAA